MTTRRNFVTTTSLGALGIAQWPGVRRADVVQHPMSGTLRNSLHGASPDDTAVRALATRALDAARSAGASYAEVHFSHSRFRELTNTEINETLGMGVRARVNECWGFASGPVWTPDEAARLGRGAAAQARANALGGQRTTQLAPAPVAKSEWVSPIVEDPFTIPFEEAQDFIEGVMAQTGSLIDISGTFGRYQIDPYFWATVQRRTLATSEGSYLAQTYYATCGNLSISWSSTDIVIGQSVGKVVIGVDWRQGGWEVISRYPWREEMLAATERERVRNALPAKPVDVGRYTVVFDAQAMAALLGATLAPATQLDRVLGYEANAGGTSYLGPDPFTVLGTAVAAPLVTVTGERSAPLALGTTKWDMEGMVPEAFPLVKEGVLVDYQTTRESAAWLIPWYEKQRMPVRSHGCANATDAQAITLTHTPNLVLQPNTRGGDPGLGDLIRSVPAGLFVSGGSAKADQQCLNGTVSHFQAQEIKNGRIVANIRNAGVLFRSPEFWKSITALGGLSSAQWQYAAKDEKGEPAQMTRYGISAVPAIAKNVTIIDITRKA